MAKTTLDDVAREAGCARATLYRLFPGGRDALWDAVVVVESARFFGRITERAAPQRGLEDVVVAIVTEAGRSLSGHSALQFLLVNEPEAILPYLSTVRWVDRVLGTVSAAGAPLLMPWLAPVDGDLTHEETAARAVEWIARSCCRI